MMTTSWERLAASKREQLASKIAALAVETPTVSNDVLDVTAEPLGNYLTAQQQTITTVDALLLVGNLQRDIWSAVEVTQAFCARAVFAHSVVNCLNEVFFVEALEQAGELDCLFVESGPVGPLHGLPVSPKNQISIKNVEVNMGYVGRVGRIAEQDSVLVKSLRAQGAVLFCTTNVPQALMSSESSNNLYGRTLNPFNRSVTCGGSSGGEGALLGMRGSPAGFGSDIGGSIRVPAVYNGLYGFRGSYHRMPYGGSVNSCEGLVAITSSLGPMTTSISLVRLLFKAVLDTAPWNLDPLCHRAPWREEEYQLCEHGGGEQLCFALMKDNGLVRPLPPIGRALETTRKALEAKGHLVVEWALPDGDKTLNLFGRIFSADGGQDIDTECARSGEPRLAGVLDGACPPALTAYEYWGLCHERRRFITTQLEVWEATSSLSGTGRPFDAIILPAAPYPSLAHGGKQDMAYTGVCSLNDFPTGTVPVTRVDPDVDVAYARASYHDFPFDQENWESYDPAFFANVPIGLQVAGRRGEDEAVIRMCEIVDEAVRTYEAM